MLAFHTDKLTDSCCIKVNDDGPAPPRETTAAFDGGPKNKMRKIPKKRVETQTCFISDNLE